MVPPISHPGQLSEHRLRAEPVGRTPEHEAGGHGRLLPPERRGDTWQPRQRHGQQRRQLVVGRLMQCGEQGAPVLVVRAEGVEQTDTGVARGQEAARQAPVCSQPGGT